MKVIFLTVAGNQGLGHFYRCKAISQALNEINIDNQFIVDTKKNINLEKNIAFLDVFKWYEKQDQLFIKLNKEIILFVDAININYNFLKKLEKFVYKLFYIDDFKNWKHKKIIEINWTINKNKIKKINNKLIGVKYAALRKSFWYNKKKIINKKIKKIFISFGGVDLRNLSFSVISDLRKKFPEYKIVIIITKQFKNYNQLINLNNKYIKVKISPNENNMKKLMMNSDIAIASGGQTLYELASLGIPTIGIISVNNQKEDIIGWNQAGFLKNIGWWYNKNLMKKMIIEIMLLNDQHIRRKMSFIGQNLVDGQGSRRIAQYISNIIK